MKHFFLAFVLLALVSSSFGQTTTENITDSVHKKIYTKVDIEASFPGGEQAWRSFLQRNLNSMVLVDNNAPDGTYTVVVKFIVREDGSLTDIFCENYPKYGVCEEGLRIIKKSPKWKPSLVDGRPVASYRRQPISMMIQN